MASLPTVERLGELLSYDSETGVIRWKVKRGRQDAGTIAGSPSLDGYPRIQVDRKIIGAHRIAWAMHHGAWANGDIDHKDRDPSNNAITNLRPAARAENMANAPLRCTNTSGFKGVTRCPITGKWVARITLKGQNIYIGRFSSPESASSAYQARAKEFWGEYVLAC